MTSGCHTSASARRSRACLASRGQPRRAPASPSSMRHACVVRTTAAVQSRSSPSSLASAARACWTIRRCRSSRPTPRCARTRSRLSCCARRCARSALRQRSRRSREATIRPSWSKRTSTSSSLVSSGSDQRSRSTAPAAAADVSKLSAEPGRSPCSALDDDLFGDVLLGGHSGMSTNLASSGPDGHKGLRIGGAAAGRLAARRSRADAGRLDAGTGPLGGFALTRCCCCCCCTAWATCLDHSHGAVRMRWCVIGEYKGGSAGMEAPGRSPHHFAA